MLVQAEAKRCKEEQERKISEVLPLRFFLDTVHVKLQSLTKSNDE